MKLVFVCAVLAISAQSAFASPLLLLLNKTKPSADKNWQKEIVCVPQSQLPKSFLQNLPAQLRDSEGEFCFINRAVMRESLALINAASGK